MTTRRFMLVCRVAAWGMCGAGSYLIVHSGWSVSRQMTLAEFDRAIAVIWAGAILGIAGPLLVFILKHAWIRRRMTALLWNEDEGARLLLGPEDARVGSRQELASSQASAEGRRGGL